MQSTDRAVGAGPALPVNEETLIAGTIQGLERNESHQHLEYRRAPPATSTPIEQERGVGQPQKVVATLIARAAIAGYELVQLADGTFIASRWGMFRSLDHIAAVDHFLRRVGAPSP